MPLVSTFSSGSSRSLGLGSGIRPGAPTITGIAYLNGTTGGRLEVSFTAGTVGTTVTTDYQYSINNGATWVTRSGTASPVVITGLTNGTSYTIRLRAVNSIGASEQSNSIIGRPIALPGAPTVSVTEHATDTGKLNVAVTAGTAGTDSLNGSTPYEYSLNSGSTWTGVSSANFTISGLADETSYTVTVRAITTNNDRSTNGSGTGSTKAIAPVVPQPSVSISGTTVTVSWGAITDANSGVASATLHELFFGSSSGYVSGSSYVIPSNQWSGSSTTFTTPSNRRTTPGGESWQVVYYIIATDNVGKSGQGTASTSRWTKPLGTFYVTTTGHGTYGSTGGWRSDLGNIGSVFSGWISNTYAYQYGYWFYGSTVSAVTKGYIPDSATFRTYRSSVDGCSGAVVAFATHNYASQPAGAPANDITYWTTGTSQTQSNAREFTLTSGTRGRMAVDSNFGMFMYPGNADGSINGTAATNCSGGTTYRVFDSPFSDANSGRLTIVFN